MGAVAHSRHTTVTPRRSPSGRDGAGAVVHDRQGQATHFAALFSYPLLGCAVTGVKVPFGQLCVPPVRTGAEIETPLTYETPLSAYVTFTQTPRLERSTFPAGPPPGLSLPPCPELPGRRSLPGDPEAQGTGHGWRGRLRSRAQGPGGRRQKRRQGSTRGAPPLGSSCPSWRRHWVDVSGCGLGVCHCARQSVGAWAESQPQSLRRVRHLSHDP